MIKRRLRCATSFAPEGAIVSIVNSFISNLTPQGVAVVVEYNNNIYVILPSYLEPSAECEGSEAEYRDGFDKPLIESLHTDEEIDFDELRVKPINKSSCS